MDYEQAPASLGFAPRNMNVVIRSRLDPAALAPYSVAVRRRELGIRMALGSSQRGLLSLVLGQGMGLAVLGLAVGLLGAMAVTRLASSLLFGVKPTDPLTFVGVAVFMMLVAFVACLVPARRATRVDPLVALREE